MKFTEYQKLYESLDKYNNEILDGNKLRVEILEWKIPNLEAVVPDTISLTNIAEVGCFTGDLIANIFQSKKGFDRYGYDCNCKAVSIASEKYPYTEFYCQDILDVDQKYDVIVLSDIVEHIQDDVNFINKTSQKAHYLLVNIPLEKTLNNIFRRYGLNDPSGHLRSYNKEDIWKLFDAARVEVITYDIKWRCETSSYLNEVAQKNDNFFKSYIRNIVLSNKILRRKYFSPNIFALLKKIDD